MIHDIDSKALEFSRQVMALVYGPMPVGGSVQLQAKIQCMFVDAMNGSYPAIPEGWVLVPRTANIAMVRAGGAAAREHMEETGGNSPAVIYSAMLTAAPQPGKGE